MLSNHKVPKGFKILSEFPILVIQYNERLSLYPIKFFLIIIVMFLTISTFIIACWLAIEPLSTLQNRIWQPDFWHFPRAAYLYFDANRFSLPGLVAIILWLFAPVLIIYKLVWSIFGIIEFRASPEKLIVKHQLFGISRTHLIGRDSLLYFKKYEIIAKGQTHGWTLKALTNQKKFFLLHSKIVLLNTKPFKYSDWLGTVLADFYQVKFLSSESDRF
jgi:hypothetical protein